MNDHLYPRAQDLVDVLAAGRGESPSFRQAYLDIAGAVGVGPLPALPQLRDWCEALAGDQPPPRIIKDRSGIRPYLTRYYLLGGPRHASGAPFDRRGALKPGAVWDLPFTVCLHHFHASDEDQALHSHPWSVAASLVLAGGYREERLHWRNFLDWRCGRRRDPAWA